MRNTTKASTPETTTKPIGRLSFCTESFSKRGAFVGRNHFDVPPEKYLEGSLTGKRLALELLLDIKVNPVEYGHTGPLYAILAGVARAQIEAEETSRRGLDTPTRKGAADGFLDVMLRYLVAGVTRCEVEKYVSGLIEQQVQSNKIMDAWDAKRKAESTAKRIAARRANKALKAAEGTV